MSNQGWGVPPPAGGQGPGTPPAPGGFGASPGQQPAGPPAGYPGAAPGTAFGQGGGGPGMPAPWGVWESFTFAWDRAKSDPGTIMGALIVGGLVANAVSGISQAISAIDNESLAIQLLVIGLAGVNLLVATFMNGGMMLFALRVARGDEYQFGDIFKGGPYFLNLLIANLLVTLGVVSGVLLLIVPGIIVGLGWGMTIPLIVDRQLSPIDALKESWRLMTGHKASLFLWGLAAALLSLLGLLACCAGLLLVGPIIQIAFAFIYLRISGQRTAVLSAIG